MKVLRYRVVIASVVLALGLTACRPSEDSGRSANAFAGTWQQVTRPNNVLQIERSGAQTTGRFIYLGTGSRLVVDRFQGSVDGRVLTITVINQVTSPRPLLVSLDPTGALEAFGERFERVPDPSPIQ